MISNLISTTYFSFFFVSKCSNTIKGYIGKHTIYIKLDKHMAQNMKYVRNVWYTNLRSGVVMGKCGSYMTKQYGEDHTVCVMTSYYRFFMTFEHKWTRTCIGKCNALFPDSWFQITTIIRLYTHIIIIIRLYTHYIIW